MTTAIALFTRDLRRHDNPMLAAAAASSEFVVTLFVHDEAIMTGRFSAAGPPGSWPRRWPTWMPASGPSGRDWCCMQRGPVVEEVCRIARQVNATEVHISADVSGLRATPPVTPVPPRWPESAVGCGGSTRSSRSSDRDGSSRRRRTGSFRRVHALLPTLAGHRQTTGGKPREPRFGFRRRSTLHPRPSRRNTHRDRGPVGKPKHVAAPTDGSTGPWRTMTSATTTWPATRLHGSRPTCTSAASHLRLLATTPRTGPEWGRPRSCAN